MKTKELIERVNVIKGIDAVDDGDKVNFYEAGQDFPFYVIRKDATGYGNGASNFNTIRNSTLTRIICVATAISEYLETPIAEREEPKLYNIIFPAIGLDFNPRCLQRYNLPLDGFKLDSSSFEFVKKHPELYAFTEKEIKAIDERYMVFAEEVKG